MSDALIKITQEFLILYSKVCFALTLDISVAPDHIFHLLCHESLSRTVSTGLQSFGFLPSSDYSFSPIFSKSSLTAAS